MLKRDLRFMVWRSSGFTLIEMLVVVMVLGLLMGLLTPSITSALIKAKKSKFFLDCTGMTASVETLRQRLGTKAADKFLYDPDLGRSTPCEVSSGNDYFDDAHLKLYPYLFVRELNPSYPLWLVNDYNATTSTGLKRTFKSADPEKGTKAACFPGTSATSALNGANPSGLQYILSMNNRADTLFEFKDATLDTTTTAFLDPWRRPVFYWVLEVPVKNGSFYDSEPDGTGAVVGDHLYDQVRQIELFFSWGPNGLPGKALVSDPHYFSTLGNADGSYTGTADEPYGLHVPYGLYRAIYTAWYRSVEKPTQTEEDMLVSVIKEKISRNKIATLTLPDPEQMNAHLGLVDYWTFTCDAAE